MRVLKGFVPKEKRDEIVAMYLNGENSYEELSQYYGVASNTIAVWVSRFRKSGKALSLQSDPKPLADMAEKNKKKKDEEKSPEVLLLEARIRELELQNLALNTLIDVAEKNGIEIRKKSGAKQ